MTAAPPPVVAVHRVVAHDPGALVGLSRDGRIAAQLVYGRRSPRVAVVRLSDGRMRFVADAAWSFQATTLSPDGRWVTFLRRRTLYVAPTDGGRPHQLVRLYAPLVTWLDDGRAAVHPARGELAAVALDGRVSVLARAVSVGATISPDGRYVLDPQRCRVRLLDRERGTVRVVGRADRRGIGPAAALWSPDSRRYALELASWYGRCSQFGTSSMGGAVVRDVAGQRLATVGRFPVWSTDGRYLLLVGGVTGTAVTYLQPLDVLDLRTRHVTHLFAGRVFDALAGPNGELVYGRYDPSKTTPDRGPQAPVRLYTARLRR